MSEETPLGESTVVQSATEEFSFSAAAASNAAEWCDEGKQQKSVDEFLMERQELYAKIKIDESTISELNSNLDSFRNTLASMAEDNAAAHAKIKEQAEKIKELEVKIKLTSGVTEGSIKKLLPALSELKSRPSTANIIGRRASVKIEEDFWASVSRKARKEIK